MHVDLKICSHPLPPTTTNVGSTDDRLKIPMIMKTNEKYCIDVLKVVCERMKERWKLVILDGYGGMEVVLKYQIILSFKEENGVGLT